MNKINKLNQYLAELNVFYRKLQNYHWYVKGNDFFHVHAKLEEYYDEINEEIDEIAELILMLGANPLGTLKDYLAVAKIKEATNTKIKSSVALPIVKDDFVYLLNLAKEIKTLADDEGDTITSAKIDSAIETKIKHIWMLTQWAE